MDEVKVATTFEQIRDAGERFGRILGRALSAEGVSVTVAATAMTMGVSGSGGTSPCIETHHIATVCNDTSSARGGPWTPRFQEIFAKAGMSMEDPADKMPLPGHYGPHPERYHQLGATGTRFEEV